MIRADGVRVVRGGREVLQGIDVEAHAGEVLALVGPNGAGKSTALGVLAGTVGLAGGTVALQGVDLAHWSASALAKVRGLLRQQHELAFAFQVHEVVALGRFAHGGRADDEERVRRALLRVGLWGLRDRAYDALSGGERQRVQLARVLCQLDGEGPRLLLLDEPTSAQDLGQQHRVLGVARGMADAGHAVVVVLHDLNQAAMVADRVQLLADGLSLAVGVPADVLTPALLRRGFGLAAQVLDLDGRLHVRPPSLTPTPCLPVEEPWT